MHNPVAIANTVSLHFINMMQPIETQSLWTILQPLDDAHAYADSFENLPRLPLLSWPPLSLSLAVLSVWSDVLGSTMVDLGQAGPVSSRQRPRLRLGHYRDTSSAFRKPFLLCILSFKLLSLLWGLLGWVLFWNCLLSFSFHSYLYPSSLRL